jgi:polyketide cyclase/dehydrase/lipid transport protein
LTDTILMPNSPQSKGENTMEKSKVLGAADCQIKEVDGTSIVQAWRDFPAGVLPTTAQRVWEIVSDFGGVKTIYPSLLSIYLTYPEPTDTLINTVRHVTFTPPVAGSPLSADNPLPFAVEQLVELDPAARRLAYIWVLGLPVKNYHSVVEVTGEDACRLTWTSTFTTDPNQEKFPEILADILTRGINQIATVLGLE